MAVGGAPPDIREEWTKRFRLTPGRDNPLFRYGRISRIPDKEGKTRVIAIVNFWSQQALKPLHDSCERVLRCLPWDCTFSQGNFKGLLTLETDSNYHSFDLKDATDRFPRFLQRAVVEALWGSDVAHN